MNMRSCGASYGRTNGIGKDSGAAGVTGYMTNSIRWVAILAVLLPAAPVEAAVTSSTSTTAELPTTSSTTAALTTTSGTEASASTERLGPAQPVRRPAAAPPMQPLRPKVSPARGRISAAGDPSASIVDFSFHPAAATVHVGDTVTWTNSGTQPHTATATNGSFDTGILKHGQSASHTFGHAGTFTYFCTVHPFMKGTVVVLAAAQRSTTRAPAAAAPGPTQPTSPAQPASAAPPQNAARAATMLPMTGMPVLECAVVGILLAGLGAVLSFVPRIRRSGAGR
jgi:plastocyanin